MFAPVSSKPDFVAQEHALLALWRDRRTFAKLRAQNADGPRWSFLDGPITANNPMGVHHAWGRTYKDVFQRYHAMRGECQRWQNGFDCQGLWVEVNVERELGFTSKRDIEEHGIEWVAEYDPEAGQSPKQVASGTRVTIELEGRKGKLRIHWKGATAADVATLSRALWDVAS